MRFKDYLTEGPLIPLEPLEALAQLRNAISYFKGHGMPGFKDRAVAYSVLHETDQVLMQNGITPPKD